MKKTASTIRAVRAVQRSKRRLLAIALAAALRARLGKAALYPARLYAALALFLVVSLSACLFVSLAVGQREEQDGLPRFRRVLLSPERLPEELKRVQDGVLVRLPVSEFDALVECAAHEGKRRVPTQLLEARYHAVLQEEGLIGEGQWKLVHTGPGPGLLNLQPFNLALRQARFENSDAFIASFDGKVPALLVETAGERTVSLEWSARAEAGPEGLQFHLEIPPCPITLLELDVPAGSVVTVLNDDTLLSGPHEAEKNDLRRWKIVCGDRQRVDLRIHPPQPTAAVVNSVPSPLVHQKTTQKLHPEGVDATFELTLDGLSYGLRELICECDSVLHLRDVVGPKVEDYSFQAGEGNKPSRLTIRLSEPVFAGTWKISCLAPLNGSTGQPFAHAASSDGSNSIAWRSPGLHLINGIPRGEVVTLWLHPDLRVESWDPGSYRLSSSELDRATGSQLLTLLGGGLGPLRRPAARLQAYAVEFSTQQLTWWRCNANGMGLTVQIGWDMSQGQLFQLPVLLPDGWEVEKVEMTPASLLGDWHVRKAAGKATLFVDLASPLSSRTSSENERPAEATPRPSPFSPPRAGGTRPPALTVQLRPTEFGPIMDKQLPIPEVIPLGARLREGALALDYDEQLFDLDVQTSAQRTEPESEGPWGQQLPDYYFRYRGQSVTGKIQIRPRPPRLHAKCESEVLVAGDEAVIESQLQLEADAGSPNTIELLLSAGDGEAWQWRTEAPRGEEATVNRVRRAERVYTSETSCLLHLFATSHPLQTAVVMAARPTSERWHLTLARPLRVREPLRLHARYDLRPHQGHWEVPLPTVLDADRMEGEVILHLDDAGLALVESTGLQEPDSSGGKEITPWRTFRYGPGEVSLTLSGQARATDRSRLALIERARLITYVRGTGVLRHHFSFQVANWAEHMLPLRLPPGSKPLAVQVDGRWLPQLLPSAAISPNEEQSSPVEFVLPVPNCEPPSCGRGKHFFEVVYENYLRPALLWQSLDIPLPQLPIAPVDFRRIWRLDPKLIPLHQERFQSQSGPAGTVELAALPRHVIDLFHLPGSLARFDPLFEDQQAGAADAVRRAVQRLYERHTEKKISLRQVVSDTALDCIKDRYSLIIDELALCEAGVGADSSLTINRQHSTGETPAPPWTACGLIAVPARSIILLTTSSGRGAALREPLSEDVEHALLEAAQHGQDASGRFRSALNWLCSEGFAFATDVQAQQLDFASRGGDWNEWQPIAGHDEDQFVVVRRAGVTALGLALSLLMALLFWLPRRRSTRRRLMLLLIVMAFTGLGVLWLPAPLRDLAWWPLLASGAVAATVYLGTAVGRPTNPPSTTRQPKNASSIAAVAGMLLLTVLGWNSRAAVLAPATVYLVPASSDAAGRQSVLVPTDLLDRLKALAKPAPLVLAGPQAVLLDAFYEGQIIEEGKQAEFVAVFSSHNWSEDRCTLIVPLAGVQLVGDVLLDGARVAPLAEPQTGYSLQVRGRGRHKIEMRFRVPVIGMQEDRNVLFTVPPLLRSRLSWRVPAGSIAPQALVKNGAQWRTDASGQRFEADLGALPLPVHLHWYQPGRPTRVTYQAAYLWDLGLEVSHLTAYLRYRVEQGAVRSLEVDVPSDLVVSAANAQRLMEVSRPSWRSRFQLRDWHITHSGNKSVLHLELPYPISGDFRVTLELLPRTPLTSPAELPLPSPRGIPADGPHYLAHRTQSGLSVQRETSQNLTRIDNNEFAPSWLGGPNLESSFQGIAYRIPPDKRSQLLLRLEPTPPSVQGDADVLVQVGSQRAEIEAVAEVTAPNKDLAVIEWELPPKFVLVAATGEDVRTWKQNDSRVFVWLNRTTMKSRIHLSGWLPLSVRGGRSHLDLDGLRLVNADKLQTRLRIAATGDLTLTAVQTHNLQATKSEARPTKPGFETRDGVLDFETEDSSYHLSCQVQESANAVARVLTLAEIADRELRFATTVHYSVTHGELRQVRLRLRNWEEEKVEVRAERVALWAGPRRVGGERALNLPLQAGVRGQYQVTLRSSMPLEKAAGSLRMPEVLVQNVERAEYFVAVVGSDLQGKATGALQAMKAESQDSQIDPVIADLMKRGGQVWRVKGSEWHLRLQPQMRDLQPASPRVYLQEQWAAVGDGRRWLHETQFWLRHEAHANLILDFVAPARILAASMDGVEAAPRSEIRNTKPGSNAGFSDFGFRISELNKRVWLHLPGHPGVRCFRVRWMYDPPEPLDRPNLAPPQVAGAITGPTLWTAMVPPGWQAALEGASGWEGAARQAELALWRAEAQLRISQDLARERRGGAGSTALSASLQRFDRYGRHVRQAFELDTDLGSTMAAQGQSLAHWLEDLQAKARLIQSEIQVSKLQVPMPESDPGIQISDLEKGEGIPLSWLSLPNGGPNALQLTARARQQTRQALIASGEWLGVLAAVWAISLLPFLRTRLSLFWPEQVALLAAIGWHLAGLTSIVLGLLLLAVFGRIFLLTRRVRTLISKRRQQKSTMTANNAGTP